MAVFQSIGKVPVVSGMLTICVMVLSTAGSISLIRFVGIASSSQVLFFILSISLSISLLVSGRRSWSLGTEALTSRMYWSVCWNWSLIFFILLRKNEANSSANCASIFPSGMGLGVLLMVMLLTRCTFSIFFHDFLLHSFSLINLLSHGCFGLLVHFMLLMGAVALSALSNSVLNWLVASSVVVFSLNSGGVKFGARVGPVNFVLSLISLVSMGYFCFFMLTSTETIQWSEMYPCNVVLVMLKLLLMCEDQI